jgi:hypothetical protein
VANGTVVGITVLVDSAVDVSVVMPAEHPVKHMTIKMNIVNKKSLFFGFDVISFSPYLNSAPNYLLS